MYNKHIRKLRAGDAKRLRSDLLENGLFAWRATPGQRVDSVLHLWVQIAGVGPLNTAGITLCGRELLPTGKDDWENIVTRRHCPVCSAKLALLAKQATPPEKDTIND